MRSILTGVLSLSVIALHIMSGCTRAPDRKPLTVLETVQDEARLEQAHVTAIADPVLKAPRAFRSFRSPTATTTTRAS